MVEIKITEQEFKEEILSYFYNVIEHMPEDHHFMMADTYDNEFDGKTTEHLDCDQLICDVHDEIMKKLEEIKTNWKVGFVPRK